MRQQNETQIAFMGDRREFAREVAADVLNEIRTLYTLEPAMNVQQAAAFLGVSEQQVRELAEAGKIPAFDTSTKGTARQWRFWKHQLAAVGMINK